MAVFDRPKTFDPNIDPVVRIEAAWLREKLREYYETEGESDPIRIELRKGSYTPHIEFSRAPAADPQAERLDAAIQDHRPQSGRRILWQVAMPAFALLLALAVAGTWLASERWAPLPNRPVK